MIRTCSILLAIFASAQANSWEKLAPSGDELPKQGNGAFWSAVWSPELQGMLTFVGASYDALWDPAELYLYSKANSWEKLAPNGSSVLPRTRAHEYHSAVWSPDLVGLLVFGGFDYGDQYTPPNNDLFLYRSEANSWEQLAPSGSLPAGRMAHSAVWSPELNGMLIFGGNPLVWGPDLRDLHLYRSQANSWEELAPGPAESHRWHSAVWAPGLGMLIFGGKIPSESMPTTWWDDSLLSPTNDLHLYRSEANSWEQLAPSGSLPAGRYLHSAVWVPGLLGMLVFGGKAYSSGSYWGHPVLLSDLHLYRSEANSWEELAPSGSLPVARFAHGAVWSPDLHGMLVFGGKADGSGDWDALTDLHLYRSDEVNTTTVTTTSTTVTTTITTVTTTTTTVTTTTTTFTAGDGADNGDNGAEAAGVLVSFLLAMWHI